MTRGTAYARGSAARAGVTMHTVKGVTGSVRELAEHFGVPLNTVWTRLARGWTIKEALIVGDQRRRETRDG